MSDRPARFNVLLDEHHAEKLRDLARRTHMNPDADALARTLLCTALDEVEPEPATIVDLLDSIPGAFEKASRGLSETLAGEGIPLDDF